MRAIKLTGFASFIEEKYNSNADKSKYDKLIKELEKLNPKNNEHVERAIAALKRGRDLGENKELVSLLNKRLVENSGGISGVIENLFGDGEYLNDRSVIRKKSKEGSQVNEISMLFFVQEILSQSPALKNLTPEQNKIVASWAFNYGLKNDIKKLNIDWQGNNKMTWDDWEKIMDKNSRG